MKKIKFSAGMVLGTLFFFPSVVLANNLTITNVSLEDRDQTANTIVVEFDISWDSSWRNETNHDAVWVVLKALKNGSNFHLAGVMKDSGVNPSGTSTGSSNAQLEIVVPSDKTGAFIRRKESGTGNITAKNVRLVLWYEGSPLSAVSTDTLVVKVLGYEMVYIPTAPFYAGDFGTSTASFKQTNSGTQPWYISAEDAITTTTAALGAWYYTSGGNTGENASNTVFTIPAAFPKGYSAFYCMKYEVTEGEWLDFFNSINSIVKAGRDITATKGDSVTQRGTLSWSSGDATITRPDRVLNYMQWMDLAVFLDWIALRPMTELEYEKISRGPLMPVASEYAWGSTAITGATTISLSPETGEETISTASANANYNVSTFSGGDSSQGAQYQNGPLRAGIFGTGTSTRVTSGAGYYGVMEMSGNVFEFAVSAGQTLGRSFTGTHGDGVYTTGTNGATMCRVCATNTDWPSDSALSQGAGVDSVEGSGLRGGAYNQAAAILAVSDRTLAAFPWSNAFGARTSRQGGRGVRTAP